MRVGIKVLGCDKNTVDSEYLAGILREKGFAVAQFDSAGRRFDALVVFTCGFIREARRESESEIKSLLELKDARSKRPKIIVAGCMPQLFLQSLKRKFPQVDAFCGIISIEELAKTIAGVIRQEQPIVNIAEKPEVKIVQPIKRQQLVRLHYGFLRIADGCSHRCSFCIIPQIKGRYRSVPKEVLIGEARQMIARGIKEINIIAQDITRYGEDLYAGKYGLVDLLKDLFRLPGDFWLRLLYAYPTRITKELMAIIAREQKICKYIDIPLQHLDEGLLKKMGRPYSWQRTKGIIQQLRRLVPEITIRSAFILGFPGETDEKFQRLRERLEELSLDRVGFFLYSAERGTKAIEFRGAVPREIARRRLKKLVSLQRRICEQRNQRWVGKKREVLVEAKFPEENLYLSRSQSEAPEVDGFVIFRSERRLKPGDKTSVLINYVSSYDFFGEAC